MMKVRNKKTGDIGSSGTFNTHGIGEMIVYFDDGDCASEFIHDYDIQLEDGSWKDLSKAFEDHDVIIDNYNTRFFFPSNEEDMKRGYTLY